VSATEIADLVTLARLRLHGAEPNGHSWRVRNNEVVPDDPHADLFIGGGTTGSYPIMVDGSCGRASDIAWFIAEAPMLIRRLCDALDASADDCESGGSA
jgi:hypothetical protein